MAAWVPGSQHRRRLSRAQAVGSTQEKVPSTQGQPGRSPSKLPAVSPPVPRWPRMCTNVSLTRGWSFICAERQAGSISRVQPRSAEPSQSKAGASPAAAASRWLAAAALTRPVAPEPSVLAAWGHPGLRPEDRGVQGVVEGGGHGAALTRWARLLAMTVRAYRVPGSFGLVPIGERRCSTREEEALRLDFGSMPTQSTQAPLGRRAGPPGRQARGRQHRRLAASPQPGQE